MRKQMTLFIAIMIVASFNLDCGSPAKTGRIGSSQPTDTASPDRVSSEKIEDCAVTPGAVLRVLEQRPSCIKQLVRQTWVMHHTPWDPWELFRESYDDCRNSVECESNGRCAINPGRDRCDTCFWCTGCSLEGDAVRCIVATKESCRDSYGCEDYGRCGVSGKFCVATRLNDCANSSLCRFAGRCGLRAGRCAAVRNEDCRASEFCSVGGLCTAKDGICGAADSGDCRDSVLCEENGRCHAFEGGCFALDEGDCTGPCKKIGNCQWERGSCNVRSDADCAKSEDCKVRGKCKYRFFRGRGNCFTMPFFEETGWREDTWEEPD